MDSYKKYITTKQQNNKQMKQHAFLFPMSD